MKRTIIKTVAIFALSVALVMPDLVYGQVAGVRVVTIQGHRKRFDIPIEDAIQRYLLIDVTNGDRDGDGVPDFEPLQPVAILLLLPGGEGGYASIRPDAKMARRIFQFTLDTISPLRDS